MPSQQCSVYRSFQIDGVCVCDETSIRSVPPMISIIVWHNNWAWTHNTHTQSLSTEVNLKNLIVYNFFFSFLPPFKICFWLNGIYVCIPYRYVHCRTIVIFLRQTLSHWSCHITAKWLPAHRTKWFIDRTKKYKKNDIPRNTVMFAFRIWIGQFVGHNFRINE